MKEKLKSIVLNGLPYGLVFFILSFILGCCVAHYSLLQSLQVSLIMGLLALLANGLLHNRFTMPLKIFEKISVEIEANEIVIVESPANHRIGEILIPGKLVLTNTRLVFKAFIDEEFEYQWNIDTVKSSSFYGSFWNRGGQFILKTNHELSLMFEVNNLRNWKDALQHEILNYSYK